ncbi:metal-sulfur cluster assembly factor [Sulfurospirillum sp. 1307]|jgi:metal-sulfur cluster biosynthetic enzyme
MTKEEEKAIKDKIIEYIKTIYDPEIPVNLYDLGLIYDIRLEENDGLIHCEVDMTLTSPGCSVADVLVDQVRYLTASVDQINTAVVNLVFDPPWDPSKISDEGKDLLALNGMVI